jgi:macrolide transport system ATP-binding/permease protein
MSAMTAFLRRLSYWLRGRRAAEELEEELRFHRDMTERDVRDSGLAGPDAVRAVHRAMGNTTLAREDARAVWVAPWIDAMWQDVRHGIRSLRRSPALVVVSAISLGLGIGLNTILFMGISTVYGHRPTMADSDRVVGVEPGYANQFSRPDLEDLRQSGIFKDVAGFRTAGMNLGASGRLTPVSLLVVTGNYFDVLGVRAQLGRTFSSAEAAAEREPRLVVVTAGFWRNRLRADPQAIGELLVIGGERFTVVGVLPDDYRAVFGWIGPQIYVPVSRLTLPAIEDRGTPSLSVLARLKDDATPSQGQAAVTSLVASLERAYPERLTAKGRGARVFAAQAIQFRGAEMGYRAARTLSSLTGALVLLIACVNVAGLLMARATERRREIAVRVAIGAGRARVIQAMLVETLLLVVAGGVLGVSIAFAFGQLPLPSEMAGLQGVLTLDTRILPYAIPFVLFTTVVCGVLPALRATRRGMVDVRQSSEGVTPRTRMRQALVGGQLAMSLFLVVATLLFVRSQIRIGNADVGFDLDHGVVARFGLDQTQYPGDERARFAERLVERIAHIPEVSSASMANLVPLGGDSLLRSFHPAGRTDIPGTRPSTYSVGPDFFRTLGIRLLTGREFDRTHRLEAPTVAIVNETFARTYFPGRDVVGQHVQTEDEPDAEIIGLVRDHRIGTIGEAPQSVIYYPFSQRPRTLILHARTSTPDGLIGSMQRAIDEIDGTVPVTVQTLRDATSLEMNMRRSGTLLLGAMGVVGLLLAMVGLYGVMTYVAASRTAEVGIRMALGASAARIRRDMLVRALTVVASGVTLGSLASFAVTPLFRTFLAGVSPFDPVAFGTAALLLTLVGLAASYIPALRSSRLDPMRALRRF